MKFKEYLKKVLEIPKGLFKRFPYSISLSIVISLILTIFMESDFLQDILIFLGLFPVGVLFSEIYFKDNRLFKYISFVISLIIALFGNKYILEGNVLITKFISIYVITLVILGLIKLYKDSKLPVSEYITRVANNLFKTQVVAGILSLGILLIATIIIALFKTSTILILRLEMLLFGVVVVPSLIYSFSDTKEKVWDFIKFIIKNLLSVILIMAFFIIYIYMLKILIIWKIPSNHIFRITSLLFILGLPIWTMISSFEEENILVKISNKLPIAFIPFIILQIYSLFVRISSNGLTITRYLGLFVIILEIIYSILYLVNKEKIYYLGYVLIVMSIIGILIPNINVEDAVVNNQYKRVIYYLNKENLSNEEHNNLISSYYYLQDFKEGKSLTRTLTNEQIEYITQSKEMAYNCYYKDKAELYSNIDVSGYNKFNEFEVSQYNGNYSLEEFEHIKVLKYNVNMRTQISRFIKSQTTNIDYKYSDTIVTDDYKLTITGIDICLEDSQISSYTINGYILEK